jgi:hypothetical protein
LSFHKSGQVTGDSVAARGHAVPGEATPGPLANLDRVRLALGATKDAVERGGLKAMPGEDGLDLAQGDGLEVLVAGKGVDALVGLAAAGDLFGG